MSTPTPLPMKCMEVWGGRQQVDSVVELSGLDAWVYSKQPQQRPTEVDAGDVHFVSTCATGRITRILVADIGGEESTVSSTAKSLRGMMRRNVNFLDQSRFVKSMDREFEAIARQGRFATAVVATYFAPTGDLAVCNSGHPAPLLYRCQTGRWSVLSPDDDPAPSNGAEGLPAAQHNFSVQLEPGDLVLCYTDALIESYDEAGDLLGVPGLLEVVRYIDCSRPEKVISELLAAIAGQNLDNLVESDVTIVLMRPNGEGREVPLKTQMTVPLKMAKAFVGSLMPGGEPMPWPEISLPNLGGAVAGSLNRLWSKQLDDSRIHPRDEPAPVEETSKGDA